MSICIFTTITQSLLFLHVSLKLREELLEERRVHHLIVPVDLLPVLRECEKHGVLVRPLEVPKRRVGPRARVDDRFAPWSVVHDFVDVQLCLQM